jgi:hypothetical protein
MEMIHGIKDSNFQLLGFTFSTDGDMELGPLDEKDATRGDTQFPMSVLGKLSFAVGDLHEEVDKVN